MGGVGDEAALALEGAVEAGEHPVEGVGEALELVVRAVEVDALVEGPVGDAPGGGGDVVDGAQDASGDEGPEDDREEADDGEGDDRAEEDPWRVASLASCWRCTTVSMRDSSCSSDMPSWARAWTRYSTESPGAGRLAATRSRTIR
nr:hypothetical protein GCM10025732_32370 [Glycomyces mayteni]